MRVHGSCVAISGRGVLILGPSGSGKSDLAMCLIDRGAALVGDDQLLLEARGGRLFVAPHERIAGMIELRGVGIIAMAHQAEAPVCLAVDLGRPPERMPEEGATVCFAGVEVPAIGLAGLEASAPLKVEAALQQFGLSL